MSTACLLKKDRAARAEPGLESLARRTPKIIYHVELGPPTSSSLYLEKPAVGVE